MFMGMYADPNGMPRKEFNKHLDDLLTTGRLNPEHLEFMDKNQQFTINEVKKALIRLENKHHEDDN